MAFRGCTAEDDMVGAIPVSDPDYLLRADIMPGYCSTKRSNTVLEYGSNEKSGFRSPFLNKTD